MKTKKLTIEQKRDKKLFQPLIKIINLIRYPWDVLDREQRFNNYAHELNRQYHQAFMRACGAR